MGQYHGIYNLDKREMVHPHDLGFGAKQREHTGYQGSLSDILYVLSAYKEARGGGDFADDGATADSLGVLKGRWHGDRVAVVGDYAAHGDLPSAWDVAYTENPPHSLIMNFDDGYFRDITDEIRPLVARLWGRPAEDLMSLNEKYGTTPTTDGVSA